MKLPVNLLLFRVLFSFFKVRDLIYKMRLFIPIISICLLIQLYFEVPSCYLNIKIQIIKFHNNFYYY